ncbi:VanZ family protein [Rossellomorea oryzaecorticis]|uniref:VanZ family protein n=1 Tax=Rossellomorea oryzaecorticis TaxID=1396505 RepID=A0ABW8VRM6_9BACI
MRKYLLKIGLVTTLAIYLLILSKLILFKHLPLSEITRHFTFNSDHAYLGNHNFIPLKTIIFYFYLADVNLNIRVENLVGNMIGFAPFGFMLPLLTKRFSTIKNIIAATLCLSLLFELIQFVFKFGSFDVDDLILNTLGGLLGYCIFSVCRSMRVHCKGHGSKFFKSE